MLCTVCILLHDDDAMRSPSSSSLAAARASAARGARARGAQPRLVTPRSPVGRARSHRTTIRREIGDLLFVIPRLRLHLGRVQHIS